MEVLPPFTNLQNISVLIKMTTPFILSLMLLDVVKNLESAGAKARVDRMAGRDAVLVIELDDKLVELDIRERGTLYSTDVPRLAQAPDAPTGRQHMLVAPFVSPRLGEVLIRAGWSWADGVGNFDIKAPGLRFRQRLVRHRPPRKQRMLPQGAGSTAILRWLLTAVPLGERIEPSVLTGVGRVSQPRVSQILRTLARQGLLKRDGRTYKLAAIEPLLDAFLRDYAGPKGSEHLAYTLDEPNSFAARASEVLGRTSTPGAFAISADVGPDLLSAWRKPSHTIIYLRVSVPLDELGLVGAHGREDANVLLRMPADATVFSTMMHRELESTTIPLVDAPQMMWDLWDLSGEDRDEAAGRLREWFVQHRKTS